MWIREANFRSGLFRNATEVATLFGWNEVATTQAACRPDGELEQAFLQPNRERFERAH
jgi:hypothetical protein